MAVWLHILFASVIAVLRELWGRITGRGAKPARVPVRIRAGCADFSSRSSDDMHYGWPRIARGRR